MEWAVETGDVGDRAGLHAWIGDVLTAGAGHNDAILLAAAWRAARTQDRVAIEEIAALARALAPSEERLLEATAQGQAFRRATEHAWPAPELGLLSDIAEPVPYPVAVGVAAAGHGIPLRIALHAFLHALIANLVSAGVRLVPLGQSDGLAVEAGLERDVAATAEAAEAATLADLGGACLLADIASMKHETQHTRLFRS
jgi:urease accessory protein